MQKIIINSLLLASFHPSLHAQETPTPDMTNLPGVIVTATRTATHQDQLATGATVYTRQDIERSQVKTLPDLFKGTIGVDIAQNGGYGQPTSLFLRGANTDHVLVLIDGIKVGSATIGTTPFELIPIDQIERVEIIRGPQSSLYGSEAIGGVIQIFTRKGSHNDKPQVTLEAGGGSYDTAHTAGTVSGKFANNWYNLGVSHINSQGFNNRQNSDPDRDGYENTSLNARIGHRFSEKSEVEAFFMRSEGINEYDSTFGGDNSAFVNQVVGIAGNMEVMDNWHSTLRLGQSLDELDTFLADNTFENRYNTARWNASWLNQLQLSDAHQLIVGTDYRVDEVESSDLDSFNAGFDTYSELSRYDVGVFTELHSRLLDKHFVNASVRWDENQAFGDYVTGNVGWRYNSDYGISPFASFGNAFKSPSFNQLYWPDTGFGGGNPLLKPEESRSFEVGLAGGHDGLQWELRAYHTDVEQLISGWPPVNVDKARIEGIEAQISTDLLGWHQKLAMNLLEPIDLETGQRLQRRSDKSLSFDLSRSWGAFDFGANVLAQGDRPDLDFSAWPATRVNLHGFVTMDLRAAWHVNKNWMLSAKLNNLLDERYQTANNYNTPDRNFFVSIHYNN
ncbi:MAG: TonB-dependent receptor [Methylovulum sp.]|nr:TonB-dependent receptor [Methylovulum sp.]